jgi:hypothetical protein
MHDRHEVSMEFNVADLVEAATDRMPDREILARPDYPWARETAMGGCHRV